MKNKRNFSILAIGLIAGIGFAVYGNSLNGEFVWDDDYLVKNNAYIKDTRYLGRIFSEHSGSGGAKPSNFYRPLQLLTYMFNYRLGKLAVRPYHLTNVLLHILAAIALFFLSQQLFADTTLALISGVLFVAHPIHNGAVAYISGRADPLALLFILLCLICYSKNLKQNKISLYLFSLIFCILGLLSRENSLLISLLLLLYHLSFRQKIKVKQIAPILTLSLIYLILRLTVLSFPLPQTLFAIPHLGQRLPSFFAALTSYLRLLLLPFNLHMEYGYQTFPWLHPQVLLGMFVFLLIAGFIVKNRNSNRLFFFSGFWFLLTLLPASNIYFSNAYMAEHWLYLPAIGYLLILSSGLNYLYQQKRRRLLGIVLSLGLLAFYSAQTIKQNRHWRTPLDFYEYTFKYNPGSVRLVLNTANAHYRAGDAQEAVQLYKQAIALEPDYPFSYNNLGAVYLDSGDLNEASANFAQAIKLKPDYADAVNNLGMVYSRQGKSQGAIELFEQAIRLNPLYAEAYSNLGLEYLYAGRQEEGIKLLKQALKLKPDYAECYFNLGAAYYKQGSYPEAIAYYEQAQRLGYINSALANALKPYQNK